MSCEHPDAPAMCVACCDLLNPFLCDHAPELPWTHVVLPARIFWMKREGCTGHGPVFTQRGQTHLFESQFVQQVGRVACRDDLEVRPRGKQGAKLLEQFALRLGVQGPVDVVEKD